MLLHSWDVSVREAIALQDELRSRVVPQPPAGFAPRLVAGADISIEKFSTRGFAGIVVLDAATMDTIDQATAVVEIGFPYVPGLLSFRELPAVQRAWDALRIKPDVLIFDGVGYAHPRRFGLACHGGVMLDTPSIGCSKSILVGRHGPLPEDRGSTADLVDRGETVGVALRLRAAVSPVYVSIGHLVDLATAVTVVQSMGSGFREPETTRRAHRLVNQLRRAAG
ncbi:MAG: endonuclease V [Gemmatimonadota bacterium]|nr:endonuclease V [Gemmatimonadota bacterium]